MGNAYLELSNLGNEIESKDYLEKALSYLEKALSMQQSLYGNEHLKLIPIYISLAQVYGGLTQHEKQIELLKQALDFQKKLNTQKQSWLPLLGQLAQAYGMHNDLKNKIAVLKEVRSIQKRLYGEESKEMLAVLEELAKAYALDKQTKHHQKIQEAIAKIRESERGLLEYHSILVLDSSAAKPTAIKRNIILLQRKESALIAYWNNGDKNVEKSLSQEETHEIRKRLPKIGVVSKDEHLIKQIITKYGCCRSMKFRAESLSTNWDLLKKRRGYRYVFTPYYGL